MLLIHSPDPRLSCSQAWPCAAGPTGPPRRPGSFLEGTRVLEKVGNGRRMHGSFFGFVLQVLIFFFESSQQICLNI